MVPGSNPGGGTLSATVNHIFILASLPMVRRRFREPVLVKARIQILVGHDARKGDRLYIFNSLPAVRRRFHEPVLERSLS